MPSQVRRNARLIPFPGQFLRGTDERLQLGGLGTQLPQQPDSTDGLGGLVGQ